jgi:hypothetical protein
MRVDRRTEPRPAARAARTGRAKRLLGTVVAGLVATVVAAGCILPLSWQGATGGIQFVSTTTQGGWKYDYYRNTLYPCAVSGYQTFVVGTKVGSSPTTAAPLYAFMHGGGFGYFDATGKAQPSNGQKVEEASTSLVQRLTGGGLMAKVRASEAGFRTLAVSYCSHDLYAGVLTDDPNNPNTDANGKPRKTNGVLEVKAAVQFVQASYPTSKFFLYGGSAGSAGTYGVAWALQQGGNAPAGIIADASVVNQEAIAAANAAGIDCGTGNTDVTGVAALASRVHPDLADIANEPDKIVQDGRLTVPILHVWNHADQNTCGAPPVACPLRDGSSPTMGYTDCIHEPLNLAIAAQGPSSRSMNLPLCVSTTEAPGGCTVHVTLNRNGAVNTDPASPADYQGAALAWINARLADS